MVLLSLASWPGLFNFLIPLRPLLLSLYLSGPLRIKWDVCIVVLIISQHKWPFLLLCCQWEIEICFLLCLPRFGAGGQKFGKVGTRTFTFKKRERWSRSSYIVPGPKILEVCLHWVTGGCSTSKVKATEWEILFSAINLLTDSSNDKHMGQ